MKTVNENAIDDGMEVLRLVYAQLRPDIPWSLVEECYLAQRRHQYESDRDIAVSEMKSAVTQFVTKRLETTE